MITLTQLGLFTTTSLALIFTPGPDIIYVVTRGMAQGRKAALAAAAGFSIGNFVHTLFAVLGLSALLMASPKAFMLIKWMGAAYLIYLGVRMVRSSGHSELSGGQTAMGGWTVFRQSVVANIVNPKVAIFFLAFFPQFVDGGRSDPRLQIILLGTLFVILVMLCFGIVGLCSGWIGSFLRKNRRAETRMIKIAGTVLIVLGVGLAWPL